MAKKKETEKKEKMRFDDFILTTMKEHILAHKDEIRKMCAEFTTIDEMPADYWKRLDTIMLELFKKEADSKYSDHYFRMTYAKRQSPYSLACKVREKQSREFIVSWVDRIVAEEEDSDDWNAYCCHQVYTHIAVMLSENSKVEKAEKKEKED
jgi:hypothetical protein